MSEQPLCRMNIPDKITSRFHFSPFNPLAFLIVITGFFALLAVFTIYLLFRKGRGFDEPVVLLLLPAYIGMWCYFVYLLYRDYPRVTIDRSGVTFRYWFSQSGFEWGELERVTIFAKEKSSNFFLSANFREATSFQLKSGEKYTIWVDAYSNGAALRQVADRIRIVLKSGQPVGARLTFEPVFDDLEPEMPVAGEIRRIAGNHMFSFRGIIFYGLNAAVLYQMPWPPSDSDIHSFLALHTLSWLFGGYELFYFELSAQHLLIRHHLLFWYKKRIPLKAIRQCVFYQQHKRAAGLRVILNDYRSEKFPAGSLNDRQWRDLREALREEKIALRG